MEISKDPELKKLFDDGVDKTISREINLGGAKEKFLGAAHGVMAYADKAGNLSAITVVPTANDKTAEQIDFIQSTVETHGKGAKTLSELMNGASAIMKPLPIYTNQNTCPPGISSKGFATSCGSDYGIPAVIPGTNRCSITLGGSSNPIMTCERN
jgi:hypothetical protein